jgi:hypothetical protein
VPCRKGLKRLEKEKNGCSTQNRGAKTNMIASKIRSRLDILKRDRVKIVLV